MSRERTAVVRPLVGWFRKQPSGWSVHTPAYETSATGWDIEARNHNYYLLIEAKYAKGPAASWFSGLVTAPLLRRVHRLMKRKDFSRRARVCWAMGVERRKLTNLYQKLLDYFSQNLSFWRMYGKQVRMKCVFVVVDGEVQKPISFDRLLKIGKVYRKAAKGLKLPGRRRVASSLVSRSGEEDGEH